MADPVTDPTTIAVVLVGVALVIAVGFFEMRFLRKKMKTRRIREAKKDTELLDEAHNAVVTTKAIAATLERQGIRSPEVNEWIREDRKSTRLNSSHQIISYAVFCLKK